MAFITSTRDVISLKQIEHHKYLSWPDFEGRCGDVRTSTEIVLYLP